VHYGGGGHYGSHYGGLGVGGFGLSLGLGTGYSGLGYSGLGYRGLGYSGLGYSGFGYGLGYSGLGYGLGYSGLGYSGLGYGPTGLSGLGYSSGYGLGGMGYGGPAYNSLNYGIGGLGYGTNLGVYDYAPYSSSSIYVAPSYSVVPGATYPRSSQPGRTATNSVPRVYASPAPTGGQRTGSLPNDLRPGMVLPDGAVVTSVGPLRPLAPAK
jgi:hypothetical protein